MKYRTLIVEDDQLIVDQIESYLDQTGLFEKPNVYQTATSALRATIDQSFDFLFLDVELPDMSGLELLKLLPRRFPTIVMSSYPKYAVDTYDSDVQIQDFLTKPFVYSRFLRALQRAMQQQVNTPAKPPVPLPISTQLVAPAVAAPKTPSAANYLFLKTGRKTERFASEDILYFKAYTIYSKLITEKGTVVVNQALSLLGQQLIGSYFMRVHRSYIVNMNRVTRFDANMIWVDTHKIPIGITYKPKVQERLTTLHLVG